jgi:hypothetical protein
MHNPYIETARSLLQVERQIGHIVSDMISNRLNNPDEMDKALTKESREDLSKASARHKAETAIHDWEQGHIKEGDPIQAVLSTAVAEEVRRHTEGGLAEASAEKLARLSIARAAYAAVTRFANTGPGDQEETSVEQRHHQEH